LFPLLTPRRAILTCRRWYALQAAYTYHDALEDDEHQFFTILNEQLLTRKVHHLKPYLTYLLRAIEALPAIRGRLVWRGIPSVPESDLDFYREGSDVYWSGLTSTTVEINVAKKFANGPGGVLFVIRCVNGRSIAPYSAHPEEEVLLSPNSRFTVLVGPTEGEDGLKVIEMQQCTGTTFVRGEVALRG